MRKFSFYDVVSSVLALIPIYLTFWQTNNSELGIVVIASVAILIFIIYTYSIVVEKFKERTNQLNRIEKSQNSFERRLESLEKDVDYYKNINHLQNKVSNMEKNMNKKGNLDPRIILILALALIIYILLRDMGLFS